MFCVENTWHQLPTHSLRMISALLCPEGKKRGDDCADADADFEDADSHHANIATTDNPDADDATEDATEDATDADGVDQRKEVKPAKRMRPFLSMEIPCRSLLQPSR